MRRAIPLRPTPATLALAVGAFALADWGSKLAGSSTIPGGPVDEAAHVLTMLLALWALGPRFVPRFWLPALITSFAIDVDHVPARLGTDFLTAGTPRPYTHSLLTIAVVLIGALLRRRRRDLFLAVALGLAVHLWRDLSEPGSGVALMWPFTNHSFSLQHVSYLAVMAAVVLIVAWRSGMTRAKPVRELISQPQSSSRSLDRHSSRSRSAAQSPSA